MGRTELRDITVSSGRHYSGNDWFGTIQELHFSRISAHFSHPKVEQKCVKRSTNISILYAQKRHKCAKAALEGATVELPHKIADISAVFGDRRKRKKLPVPKSPPRSERRRKFELHFHSIRSNPGKSSEQRHISAIQTSLSELLSQGRKKSSGQSGRGT